ncbi:MAG: DUF3500 domain-containing protein [Opitutales bacterium]|jgi:hypothetical protein|nr:DUF3500 domain-containing protein [Opitutales bacterium]MBT7867305.1 DUF3500 domain-containing protein [Opitutales bacterium]
MFSNRFYSTLSYLAIVGSLAIAPQKLSAHSGEHLANMAMSNAAASFLHSLNEKQRNKTTFDFDHPHRVSWEFLPAAMIKRKGIALTELDKKQKMFAYDLLESGLSKAGNEKIRNIVDLERVLLELTGSDIRVPELYSIMIFGEPSIESNWAWRFEGHHVSLNFTIVDGTMTATAPRFLGSNPAKVPEGDRKGLRALGEEEDLARELFKSLDTKQQKTAHFQSIAYGEIVTNRATEVGPLSPVGIRASRLSSDQQKQLETLIETYASSMPKELANERMNQLHEAGMHKIRFGWAGGTEVGEPHYYRIQGPTFLIEYDNVQNSANHVHTIWRDFDGDFGRDLLKDHYLNHPH